MRPPLGLAITALALALGSATAHGATKADRLRAIAEAGSSEKALGLFAKMPEIRQAMKVLKMPTLRVALRTEENPGGALSRVLSVVNHELYFTGRNLRLRTNDLISEPGGGWDLVKQTK